MNVKVSRRLKKKANTLKWDVLKGTIREADVTMTKEASFSDKKRTGMMQYRGEQMSRGERKKKIRHAIVCILSCSNAGIPNLRADNNPNSSFSQALLRILQHLNCCPDLLLCKTLHIHKITVDMKKEEVELLEGRSNFQQLLGIICQKCPYCDNKYIYINHLFLYLLSKKKR